MQNDNLKSYLNLHLIVFIWGFTAILGALITIPADDLVWYRMLIASGFIGLFLVAKKKSFRIPVRELLQLVFVGLLIALHWIFFFKRFIFLMCRLHFRYFHWALFLLLCWSPFFMDEKYSGTKCFLG